MGLNKTIYRHLEQLGKAKASALAKEASEKLSNYTRGLIDWYYGSYASSSNGYERTWNLYNSYAPFLKNGKTFWGAVKIPGPNMTDYPGIMGQPITSWGFMSTYIYNPKGTWHGGDWHGGFGRPTQFSFYDELHKYHEKLKDEYRKRLST